MDKEKIIDEFNLWHSQTRNPIGDGFPVTTKQIADFWLSKFSALRAEEREKIEKMKVAKGNYNCGEEGCCDTNPEDERELNDFEWQIGYNQAIDDIIKLLEL